MFIDGDPAFPHVRINVVIQTDRTLPMTWERTLVEGRPDRQWTSTQPRCPFYWQHCPSAEQIQKEAEEWWDNIKDKPYGPESHPDLRGKPMHPNYSDVKIEIGEIQYDTWILDWFSHLTYDLQRSDEELIASFERYVRRVRAACNYDHETMAGKLMGAEDRWRWCASGRDADRKPPPCRCEHCTKNGIVRIDH